MSSVNVGWIRGRVLIAARGLLLALLSQVVAVPLFVASVLAILFVGLGFGIFALPAVMTGLRRYADYHRRVAGEWAGVPIADPYRPRPDFAPFGVVGAWQRTRWLLTDPA